MNLTLLDSQSLLIIIIHAFLSVVGGIFITYGYQKGETSFVSIFEYSFLFFATSWGVIFLSDYIHVREHQILFRQELQKYRQY